MGAITTISIIVNISFILAWLYHRMEAKSIKKFYNLHDLEKGDYIVVDWDGQEIVARVINNNANTRTITLQSKNKNKRFDGMYSYNSMVFDDRWAAKN